MPSAVKWQKNGPIAAALFRDFHFKKYDDKTPVAEIHADPTRSYNQINLNTFYKHVKNTKQRVLNFQRLETGLDSEEFKNLVRLHEPPRKEDQGAQLVEENSDDEDTDYSGEEEFDIEDDNSVTLDTAFQELRLNGKISDVEIPKAVVTEQEKASPQQKAKMPLPIQTKSFHDTVCMVYPDGERILVIFELDGDTDLSQVDHSAKVKFSKCGKIMKRFTTVPEEKFDAIALIGGVGIVDDENPEKDEDIANLQAYLDKKKDDVDIDEIGTKNWEL
jgi:hypothetical protein